MDEALMADPLCDQAEALLDLIESDFGQSGRDVRLEAIRCELEAAYQRGREDEARDRL